MEHDCSRHVYDNTDPSSPGHTDPLAHGQTNTLNIKSLISLTTFTLLPLPRCKLIPRHPKQELTPLILIHSIKFLLSPPSLTQVTDLRSSLPEPRQVTLPLQLNNTWTFTNIQPHLENRADRHLAYNSILNLTPNLTHTTLAQTTPFLSQ